MKKFILLLLVISSLFMVRTMYAQTVTVTKTTPTDTQKQNFIDKEINNLKDKIASKVAELKLVEKKGIIGTVSQTSNTQITLSDLLGNTRFVDVDELTKFASPSAKGSFGISDLSKGSQIGVLGLYNKQSRRILARFIDVLLAEQIIRGHIIKIDRQNYVLTVATEKTDELAVDFESTTKTQMYTKDDGLSRTGFSKLKENEKVYIAGFPGKTDKNRITADRIIVFPTLPKNPKIKAIIPTQEPTPTDTPTPTPKILKRTLQPTASQ